MKNTLLAHVEQLSIEEQSLFEGVVLLALGIYHRYTGMLTDAGFRSVVVQQEKDIAPLFEALYVKKIISWKDLSIWLRNRRLHSTVLVGKSSSPSVVQKELQDTTVHIESDEQIGLLLSREGNIYKRSLNKDVQKLLK